MRVRIGFDKAANPNAPGTLQEAMPRSRRSPASPHSCSIRATSPICGRQPGSTMPHIIGTANLDVHYVPGEHDILDDEPGKAYLER